MLYASFRQRRGHCERRLNQRRGSRHWLTKNCVACRPRELLGEPCVIVHIALDGFWALAKALEEDIVLSLKPVNFHVALSDIDTKPQQDLCSLESFRPDFCFSIILLFHFHSLALTPIPFGALLSELSDKAEYGRQYHCLLRPTVTVSILATIKSPSSSLVSCSEQRNSPVVDANLLQPINDLMHTRELSKHARIPPDSMFQLSALFNHAQHESSIASWTNHLDFRTTAHGTGWARLSSARRCQIFSA
ncbi:hypothetical protein KCU73_g174, partial [Aureobasidium melanogenum]